MAKDTYYFPHDYTPTDDPKIMAMLGEYGANGYGLYWRIVEMLHVDTTHQIAAKKYLIIAIAKQMLLTYEYVKKFIDDCVDVFELFTQENEVISCDRVLRNVAKKNDIIEKRKAAGSKGGVANAKQKVAKGSNKTKLNHTKPEEIREKEKKEMSFEIFWDLYGKKEDRQKCIDKFLKLDLSEIEKILTVTPLYVKSKPDVQFRKNPLTWLNGKCWNDEMVAAKHQSAIPYDENDPKHKW